MFKMLLGVIIPFLGTSLGAFLVFFLKDKFNKKLHKIMLGFAGGVMMASSVWSLIIPAIKQSEYMGKWLFLPAFCGICLGVLFMLLLAKFCLNLSIKSYKFNSNLSQKNRLLFWAVTIHNIPEGMAVGVALSGAYFGDVGVSMASALALSIGIAVQNIPEGTIVSMPLIFDNFSKKKAFLFGVMSGIVEPMFAIISIILAGLISAILPYLLAFAAGAMIYVSIDELVPESHCEDESKISTISFVVGFLLMMILDVVLG